VKAEGLWTPVWWNRTVYGRTNRVRAIAGARSRTGTTVHIRAYFPDGLVDRYVKPKNLEPRVGKHYG